MTMDKLQRWTVYTKKEGDLLYAATKRDDNGDYVYYPDVQAVLAKKQESIAMLVVDAKRLEEENAQLTEALRIIAGEQQCADNLLGNVDIAKLALKKGE